MDNFKTSNGKKKVILKSLNVNSDFQDHLLSSKNVEKLNQMLDKIEKKIPNRNIERLDNLKEKNQEPRLLIETIFNNHDNDQYKRLLISNFENNLRTVSRSPDKLIIFYQMETNKFILIHSIRKSSLYSHQKKGIHYINIEENLFDQKDFLRIAFFIKDKSGILVKIKDISQSTFFDRWLNFKNFIKSTNRELSFKINDDGITLHHNPSDLLEFYNKLLNKEILIKNDSLIFYKNGELVKKYKISSIEYEDKIYTNTEEFDTFINHFIISHRYPELIKFKEKLKKKINEKIKQLDRWFSEDISNNKIIFFESAKKIYTSLDKDEPIEKPNLDNLDYIVCSYEDFDYTIEPDQDFINLIQLDIKNNFNFLRILHVMEKIDFKNPFKINSIMISNKIKLSENYKTIEECITTLLNHIKDNTLQEIIRILKIHVFLKFINNKHIKFFLKKIMNNFELILNSEQYIDKESKILEFKSKRAIESKNQNEILEYFLQLAKKYFHYKYKFIIIGIEDKDKVDGIDKKFIKSDLIGNIQGQLNIFLEPNGKRAYFQHVKLKNNKFLIILIIY
ncbi:MAG: hypothetical protein ACTSSM_09190 [Promethearchaeota archaeon]